MKKIDLLLINSPLKNYDTEKKYNNQTLPVLGLAYIATVASKQGFNVEVIDAEAKGMGIREVIQQTNNLSPRWVGLNLLAPTYNNSLKILQGLDSSINVMLGGHQTRAMSQEILKDSKIPRIDAMIIGEAELRVVSVLENINNREKLPLTYWRDIKGEIHSGICLENSSKWLVPDINNIPFVDRRFLSNDPFISEDGSIEANMVGSRGCPYDCSFCGAARSVTQDVKARRRHSLNILQEQKELNRLYGVTSFRFVDELFLADSKSISEYVDLVLNDSIARQFRWDANGRINIFEKLDLSLLCKLKKSGLREVAFGIESGDNDMLVNIGKQTNVQMIRRCVKKTLAAGINVKGFFIMGFPNETETQIDNTKNLIEELNQLNSEYSAQFRASVFEFRPYPGTKEWNRILDNSNDLSSADLLQYSSIDITQNGKNRELYDRDEFSSSLNYSFSKMPIEHVRQTISETMINQKNRLGK